MAASLLALLLMLNCGEAISNQPPEAELESPQSVDYVAMRVSDSPYDSATTIRRHGRRLRQDQQRGELRNLSYSDLDKGVSISVAYDENGRFYSFQAGRMHHRHANAERERTGERDDAADCHIWQWTALFTWRTCIADDGVELWRMRVTPSGHALETTRSLAIRREPVSVLDVTAPDPAEIWGELEREQPRAGPNWEVLLEAEGQHLSMVRRRMGSWSKSESRRGELVTRTDISAGGAVLAFSRDEVGRPFVLSIVHSISPRQAVHDGMTGASLGITEERLGETCEWRDMRPNIRFLPIERECQTSDGAPLLAVFGELRFSARAIRRNVNGVDDFQPSPQVFEWD